MVFVCDGCVAPDVVLLYLVFWLFCEYLCSQPPHAQAVFCIGLYSQFRIFQAQDRKLPSTISHSAYPPPPPHNIVPYLCEYFTHRHANHIPGLVLQIAFKRAPNHQIPSTIHNLAGTHCPASAPPYIAATGYRTALVFGIQTCAYVWMVCLKLRSRSLRFSGGSVQ